MSTGGGVGVIVLIIYSPTGAIANGVGLEFLAQLEADEELRAELSIDGFAEDRVTYNVVAQTKAGNQDKVIVVGGHSDSVPLGPVSIRGLALRDSS